MQIYLGFEQVIRISDDVSCDRSTAATGSALFACSGSRCVCFAGAPSTFRGVQYNISLSFQGVLITVCEFFTGFCFGLVMSLWFSLFSMAGHIISMQMGLGMAQMNDPAGGVSVTVVSQIYQLAAVIMFFLIDGHMAVIAIVLESFSHIPPGSVLHAVDSVNSLINYAGWMFAAAFIVILPGVISLLIINIAFGFMSRAAPQLNLLSLGFPLSLLSGLLILSIGFEEFPASFRRLTQEAILLLRTVESGGMNVQRA